MKFLLEHYGGHLPLIFIFSLPLFNSFLLTVIDVVVLEVFWLKKSAKFYINYNLVCCSISTTFFLFSLILLYQHYFVVYTENLCWVITFHHLFDMVVVDYLLVKESIGFIVFILLGGVFLNIFILLKFKNTLVNKALFYASLLVFFLLMLVVDSIEINLISIFCSIWLIYLLIFIED